MKDTYELGLVIGRFQMLHNGHLDIINNALNLCKQVIIYIGSSQAYGTMENPFSYEARRNMIEAAYPIEYKIGRIIVRDLPDAHIGNNYNWGRYILDRFTKEFGRQPDIYVTGVEKERPSWFAEKDAPSMHELRISRSATPISATECRQDLIEDRIDDWKSKVSFRLWSNVKFYQDILKQVKQDYEKKAKTVTNTK